MIADSKYGTSGHVGGCAHHGHTPKKPVKEKQQGQGLTHPASVDISPIPATSLTYLQCQRHPQGYGTPPQTTRLALLV